MSGIKLMGKDPSGLAKAVNVNFNGDMQAQLLAYDPISGETKSLSVVQDNNGEFVLRVVDAAPFAYDEGLDVLKIVTHKNVDTYVLDSASGLEPKEKREILTIETTDYTSVRICFNAVTSAGMSDLKILMSSAKNVNALETSSFGYVRDYEIPVQQLPSSGGLTRGMVSYNVPIYGSVTRFYVLNNSETATHDLINPEFRFFKAGEYYEPPSIG